jgi:predicted RNA-binding protein YlqC (UPF0109 family)
MELRNLVADQVRSHIECVLKLMVDDPTDIQVSIYQGEKTTVFKVDCSQQHFAKILGKGGKLINSLRNVVLAMTAQHGFRSVVEIPYFPPSKTEQE